MSCCPRHAIICEMFKSLPLEPALTMVTKRLSLLKLFNPILPESFVALFKMLVTWNSNSSSLVLPVVFSKMPRYVWSIKFLTSFFFEVMDCVICAFVAWSAMRSLMPTL